MKLARWACAAVLAWSATAAGAPWAVHPPPRWLAPVEPVATDDGLWKDESNGRRHLLYDNQVRVEASAVDAYVRVARQITNEAGLTATSQIAVEFDPTFETLDLHFVTVRRGDATFDRLVPSAVRLVQREANLEAQIFDGRESAVLFVEDLRVGDVVDYAYTIHSRDPTLQGHYVDSFPLAASEPIGRLHVRVTLDGGARDAQLKAHGPTAEGDVPAPAKTERSAGVEYEWDLRGVKAFVPDVNTPGWFAAVPWMQVSDFAGWADVASLGARLFGTSASASPALTAWVARARAEAATAEDYLLRATRLVQDEVRYVAIEVGMSRRRPTDPSVVFERRYGDCKDKTALLVALLRLDHIDAHAALVSTTYGHTLGSWLPTVSAFDHAIVHATIGDAVYWIDPTVALQGGGADRLRYSPWESALVLAANTTGLEVLPAEPDERASPSVHDHYAVEPVGSNAETRLDSERTYEGVVADGMRAQLRSKTQDEITKYFVALYQQDFPAVHQAAPVEQFDDREHDVLRLVVHLAIPRFWTDDKDGQHATVVARLLTGTLSRPGSTATRLAPIEIPYPAHLANVIDVDLPFDLDMTPSETDVSDSSFAMHFASSYANRHLRYTYDLKTQRRTVVGSDVAPYLEKVDAMQATLVRTLTYHAPNPIPPAGFPWLVLFGLIVAFPLVGWGVVRTTRIDPRRPRLPPELVDARLVGIGGWLVVLAIGIVANPVREFASLVTTLVAILTPARWAVITAKPALAALCIAEVLMAFVAAAYGARVAFLFFQKRRAFPLHFTIFAVGLTTWMLLDAIFVSAFSPERTGDAFAAAVQPLIWSAIWVSYVHASKRVAFTFVERPPKRKRKRSAR